MRLVPLVLVTLTIDAGARAVPDAAPPLAAVEPPSVRRTRWPAVMPCARAADAWIGRDMTGTLAWSSDDGAETRTLVLPTTEEAARQFAKTVPMTRLTRVTGGALPASWDIQSGEMRPWLTLVCANKGTVAWGPCDETACQVEVDYITGPLPTARAVTRWTRPLPWPHPEQIPSPYSLFHKELIYGKATETARVRFARDEAAGLRDVLRLACVGDRCGAPVRAAVTAVAAFLHASPSAASSEHQGSRWRVTSGGVTADFGCLNESQISAHLQCWFSFDLPDGGFVVYHPRAPWNEWQPDVGWFAKGDVRQERPLGAITLTEAYRDWPVSRVALSGTALSMR